MKNEFKIELAGNTSEDRKVPLSVAIKTFEGLQDMFYEIGNMSLEDTDAPLGKGRRSRDLKQYCELYLTEAKAGSLHATMELPPSREDLAKDIADLPEKIITEFREILESLATHNITRFRNSVKHAGIRKKFLEIYNYTFPNDRSEYGVSITFKDEYKIKDIIKIPKESVGDYVGEQPELIYQQEDSIFIRAELRTTMNSDGKPDLQKAELISFESSADTRPYRANIIQNESVEILMKHEIVCHVGMEDGYYVVENEELELSSSGKTRELAIKSFNSDFAMLYDQYYLEDDANMTKDAILLKRKLETLIKGGQLSADC